MSEKSQTETAAPGPAWETFYDMAYYGMWCVRRVGDRDFGRTHHVATEEAARELVEFLNEVARLIAAAPALLNAARALLADVRSRYPGEALRCPHMIALDKAVNDAE